MVETVISIRAARLGDEGEIATVHDAAWREAYRGVIPGRELERMIARRGPEWWRLAIARRTPLLVLEFGDSVVGYISYGRNRVPALGYGGEIFELYLAPECQGCGFGRRMFDAARKDLAGHGYRISSSGRWRTTTGRSGFTAGWAGGSCAARAKPSAASSAIESLSASAECSFLL